MGIVDEGMQGHGKPDVQHYLILIMPVTWKLGNIDQSKLKLKLTIARERRTEDRGPKRADWLQR
jgi:hypothetical protein